MNTSNNHPHNFEKLLSSSKEDFSLSPTESQKLAHSFYTKLSLHKIEKEHKKASPYFFHIFSQKIVMATFSMVLIVAGFGINYYQSFTSPEFYTNTQTSLIQNNIALLVKNPLTLSPDIKSSLIDAHTAYADSIESHVIATPEDSFVESSGILGLYKSALSMVLMNKNSSIEVIRLLESLIDDTKKRTNEYEEQIAITSIVEDSPALSNKDYSRISSAITSLIKNSQELLDDHKKLDNPNIREQLEILQVKNNSKHNSVFDLTSILKESTEIYEQLSLSSVL